MTAVAVEKREAVGDRQLDVAAVAVPAALAAVLCLIDLTRRSIGFDEAATAAIAAQHGHALASAIARDGGNMSAYYVLMHVLTAWFGSGTLVLRLPSVLSITATAALVPLIGLRLFDRRTAFVAGLLTAVSMPLVFWGQDARAYAPMVALVTGSMFGFAWFVEGEGGRPALAAYFACTTLAAFCSFVAVLAIPVQLVMLYWRRSAVRPVLVSLAASVVCWIPLIVLAIRRGQSQIFWVPHVSLRVEKQVLESLTSAGLEPTFHTSATMWALMAVTVVGVLAVAVLHIVRASRPALRETALWGQRLVLLWVAAPVALAFVESLVAQPTFTQRNLLMCVPAVALVLAIGITDRRLPPVATWGALALLIVLRAIALVPTYAASPEDWQRASSYVLANAQPDDCVAFYPQDARMAFEYYIGRDGPVTIALAPRSVLPVVRWGVAKPFVEQYQTLSETQIAAIRKSCPRLWLVASHQGQGGGPSAESRRHWTQYKALLAELEGAYGQDSSTAFGYAATIYVDLLQKG
jgi:mannosyltransferase